MTEFSIFNEFFDYSKLNIEIFLRFGFCFLELNVLYRQTLIFSDSPFI
jgi:hypothetical protein